MKDIDKIYALTGMSIRVFNRVGRLLLYSEVKEIGHYGVVRDYTLDLRGGGSICIDAGIIKNIVDHENEETKGGVKWQKTFAQNINKFGSRKGL